jgi:biotin-dependent carboxylase-like uncharacterized protein
VLRVLATGPQVLVQDRGRFGYAHLGVPRGGALDTPAAALANRLVGNDPDLAVLEVLMGGLVLRAEARCWVAVTGAPAPVVIDGVAGPHGQALWLRPGATLSLGTPTAGMRSYLAVGGGIDVALVLGSRSTDTLAWVGPPAVVAGALLPVGPAGGAPAGLDTPRPPSSDGVRVSAGPHPDWFADDALDRLARTAWTVRPASDRVGLRLNGTALPRLAGELPSEGTVSGAIQVPPDGQPVVLLADHGPTGGYPVVAVVHPDDLWQLAQLRPGERVSLRLASPRR